MPDLEWYSYIQAQLFAFQRSRRQFCEGWSESALKEHTDAACPNCKEHWCCNQIPLVHVLEGAVIAHALGKRNEWKLMEAIVNQGKEQTKVIEAHGGGKDPNNWVPEPATVEWFDRHEGCALLDENGKCRIYHMRPTACHTYWVLRDGTRCAPPAKQLVPAINNSQPIQFTLMGGSETLTRILGLDVAPSIYVPLPLGLAVEYGAVLVQSREMFLKHVMKLAG